MGKTFTSDRLESMSTGPNIPQELRLVTAIPGPKSQEIIKRRSEAVSASLGMAFPVVV
jgi:4-aminobutyrate aminotransferase/(S)-3-amino-2-methylpropionate transaminase